MYSQLKAYSEKQLSSTPIITVRVEGAITEAGEVLAIFPQVFRFPAMPSFLSQSLTSHEVLSRCACDDILNLLSLNSPGWANQLVTSSRYSFIIVYADDFSSGASVSEYHHKVTFSLRSSSEIESSDIMVFTRRV